jgi:hypothetical protein
MHFVVSLFSGHCKPLKDVLRVRGHLGLHVFTDFACSYALKRVPLHLPMLQRGRPVGSLFDQDELGVWADESDLQEMFRDSGLTSEDILATQKDILSLLES